jgi:L-asparaginase II
MIALSMAMGWDPHDYHLADHPVQRRMAREVSRWTGMPSRRIPTGVDGCGVVCFATPLDVMARAFAAYTAAGDAGDGSAEVIDAMTSHPFMVGGTGRTCTDVMNVAGDRVFVKLGAEGVYGAGLIGQGIGVAIKVEDGGRRAVEVALLRVLEALGILDPAEVTILARHAHPRVYNTLGAEVGEIRAAFELEPLATTGGA